MKLNERIKELAEQAKKNEPFECSYTKEQWLEKFAELIVQECVDHAFHRGDDIAYLKEHFGVNP